MHLVLSKLCPSIDIKDLKLPRRSCANYMRMAEMPTLSSIHKATSLVQTDQGHLNSDGTTLNMKKLIGFFISGTVLGVQEVSDGTSETMIKELDKQLTELRNIAKELEIPNANSINWTLIVSSTSDGASTQTKLNRLLQELRARDHEQFGPENASLKVIVSNKCGMHLGVNIRKAQNAGITEYEKEQNIDDEQHLENMEDTEQSTPNQKREHVAIDTFVHSFCKLLGQHGTPEYGQGNTFTDYVNYQLTEAKLHGNNNRVNYLQNVLNTTLQRQVGSRYFVTAYNSVRIFFYIQQL